MLYQLLAETAAHHAARTALDTGERTLDYGELLAGVDRFAGFLASRQLGRGDSLAMLLPNGPEFVIAVFAAARIGAVVVPMNAAYKSPEIEYYLNDSQACALLTTPVLAAEHAPLLERFAARGGQVVTRFDGAGADAPAAARAPEEGAFLRQYSSGSTGTPKPVVRTQRQVLAESASHTRTARIGPEDRILVAVPLFHAHGFCNCMMAAVCNGASMIVLDGFAPRRAWAALVEKRVTVFPGVPFLYSILADSPGVPAGELPSLRLAYTAGAALPKATFDAFAAKFNVPVRQLYGSTETGAVAMNTGSTDGERWASIGRPLSGIEIRIVDEEDREVGPGETGELLVKSPAATTGYPGRPEETRRAFQDGWYRTGDVGRRDAEGDIYLVARKRPFINAGGNKVDPGEVEALLEQHPRVRECAVVGIRGQYNQEIVKAVIVAEEGLTQEALLAWCRGRISDWKLPRKIEFRAELPKSPLGKILRKYLQEEMG
jgi:long-chain acyl-CoA synthetase